MAEKERLLKLLGKKLSIDQYRLLTKTVSIEEQRDIVVFRMPVGLIALESIMTAVEKVSKDAGIKVKQTGQFATLEELDDLLGDIEWLWNKWVPRGFVTMIAGDPGIGKSAFVQWLVKIVTEGGCFPLENVPLSSPGNAVWVDTEASQQILKVRANTMKINKKKVFLPVIMGDILSQANLGIDQHREMLINLIEGTTPDILVLDSLGGSHARGENKVEDIRPILEFLALVARDYAMSVIVVHHLNKGSKDESPEVSLYRLRGSTIIPAMCRSIFAIEKSYDGSNRVRMIKNNLAKAADPISVLPLLDRDEEIMGFEFKAYEPPPSKKTKKELCAEWVMVQLEKHPGGISPKEMEELALGMFNRQNLYSAKDALGDRVTYSGTGNSAIWSLTQAPEADLVSVNKILSSANGNGNGKHKTTKGNVKHERARSKAAK